jgi:3-hydroxybutyryl-CoA dehydrogenase
MKKILIIGAGLMGHGIAQIFALKGFYVHLMDTQESALDAAIDSIRSNLVILAQNEHAQEKDIEPALDRISTGTDMEAGAGDAEFVIEAVFESLELKQEIFKTLDAVCPKSTILATNTSVISITEIAAKTRFKDRVVGTHFWNPPYLIPLVEVIRGDETASDVMDRTMTLMKEIGKHPVRVQKDVPGFVGNRLQHALWREAISIVENGIADAATVDECVKFGFGLRLPVLGPLENADLVGIDLTLAIHDYILKHLEASGEPSPLLKTLVDRGDLGFKSGRGLQKWSQKDISDTQKKLKEYLLKKNI